MYADSGFELSPEVRAYDVEMFREPWRGLMPHDVRLGVSVQQE